MKPRWLTTCYGRLLILLSALVLARPASAHDPALSGIKFIRTADGITVVSVITHISRLNAADPDAAIRHRLKIRFDGHDYAPGRGHLALDRSNDLLTWQAEYGEPVRHLAVLQRLYPEDPASRFSVVVFEKGRVTQQALLDADHPSFGLDPRENDSTLSIAGAFLRQGIAHIFGGFDHICFILGLLLFGGTLKTLLKTVTAFTLAHSLTLSLAVLGVWTPAPRVVEPLIALSIIAVALENFRAPEQAAQSQKDWRPYIAFGFGLVHGFGFAGALREIGLPHEALGPALASFNIGVELGQACIVLAVSPLLAVIARKSRRTHRGIVLAGSGIIALLGLCWFVQRAGLVA